MVLIPLFVKLLRRSTEREGPISTLCYYIHRHPRSVGEVKRSLLSNLKKKDLRFKMSDTVGHGHELAGLVFKFRCSACHM